jgi:GlpG protein
MSRVAALRLPIATDLSGFVDLLRSLDLPYRVSEESGEQVLWVPGEALAEQVRGLYTRFPQGNPQPPPRSFARPAGSPLARLKRSPATAALLLLTLVVAALTFLGDNFASVRWLTFQDLRIEGDHLQFVPLAESLDAGQWWRLVTPMLLHFGFLHLAMNALWYWELGARIEARQGASTLLALTLLFSLASNFGQYLFGGPALFGGLSGVLYGLLGHCWIFQRLAPDPAYQLPKGVLGMMLIWLLVCLSGLIGALGFGAIANAAHVTGLLAGCLSGLLGGLLARRSQADSGA